MNSAWIIELGQSSYTMLPNIISQELRNPDGNAELSSSYRRMNSNPSLINFTTVFKPLQDINLNLVGERCFILTDNKMQDVYSAENKKEKLVMSETGNIMLLDVANSKKPGLKRVYLNSLVKIRNELTSPIKLQLECEGMDISNIDLDEQTVTHIPVKYCTADTIVSVFSSMDKGTALQVDEMIEVENEIRFSSFFGDNQQFTNLAGVFFKEENANSYDKIVEKDSILTIFMKNQDMKVKTTIAATVYRKKIYVTNRGNQREFVYSYMITLRPIMEIKNTTPRSIQLKINNKFFPVDGRLLPNESFSYIESTTVDEGTPLKVEYDHPG